jgi:integrase
MAKSITMKSTSNMVVKVAGYLAHRRSLGYALKIEGELLLDFGRYADRIGHQGPLTLALALEWARLPTRAHPTYWARRLSPVRGLAKYLLLQEPNTEVPPMRILGPASRRLAPHIYSPEEITQLLAKARRLSQGKGLPPLTVSTVIGLMASTGMRISEVLRLRIPDVDLKNNIITVREAKFHKSRLLPLHATVAAKLVQYDKSRHRYFPSAQTFFVGRRGLPLSSMTIHRIFQGLVQDIPGRGDRPRPRLHDMRHTFACRLLIRWSKHPVILDQRILWLMHYLGHTHVSNTYWYLSAIPDLMAQAAVHFEDYLKRSV